MLTLSLHAIDLSDCAEKAVSFLQLQMMSDTRHFSTPVVPSNPIEPYTLLLAIDALGRRQIWAVETVEKPLKKASPLQVTSRPVFGDLVLEPLQLFVLPVESLTPLLFSEAATTVFPADFSTLRLAPAAFWGHTRLEVTSETTGLLDLLRFLRQAEANGLQTVLLDPYGAVKKAHLPHVQIIDLGRTHAFSLELWGVEALMAQVIQALPPRQEALAWQQWQSISAQHIFNPQGLHDLEALAMQTQSGLLLRVLQQFKQNHLFYEGPTQHCFDLLDALKTAQAEGKILVLDLSQIPVAFQTWVLPLLSESLRQAGQALHRFMLGFVQRHAMSPALATAEQNFLDTGANLVVMQSQAHSRMSWDAFRSSTVQHLLQWDREHRHLLYLSEASWGIPLRFAATESLTLQREGEELSPAETDFTEPLMGLWKDIDSLSPLPTVHADELSACYSSILGELSALEPKEEEEKEEEEASYSLDAPGLAFESLVVDSPHAIHPCLPETMLDEVSTYIEPESSLGTSLMSASPASEALLAPSLSYETELDFEAGLDQEEAVLGASFDPFQLQAPSEVLATFALPPEPVVVPEPQVFPEVEASPEAEAFVAVETPTELLLEEDTFYDALLSHPLVEAHDPNQPSSPFQELIEEADALHHMTLHLDVAQPQGDISLPVSEALEIITPPPEEQPPLVATDLDEFDFDLGVIHEAVNAEMNRVTQDTSDLPVFAAEPMRLDPEDPLGHFEFSMPVDVNPTDEDAHQVQSRPPLHEGMMSSPDFLVPELDGVASLSDPLLQSFQQELDDFDASPLLQDAPSTVQGQGSATSSMTPPPGLDAVPIEHTPFYTPAVQPPSVSASPEANLPFTVGMKVSHASYGMGVIHAIVDVENRHILSIVFEKAGKRLMDPALTPITLIV